MWELAFRRLLRGRLRASLRASTLARRPNRRTRALQIAVGLWTLFYLLIAIDGGSSFDSHAYWLTRHGIHYFSDPGKHDAYLYSPAFAHAIRPLTLLPWPVFGLIWASLATATYLWLARAVEPRWRIPLVALCLGDIVYGNVWWLFAITLAFGARRPALWAIPLLLKLTPAVGLIWFAVRREWRQLTIAVTVAALITSLSFLVAPTAWIDWIGFLRQDHDPWWPDQPVPLAVRLLGAFALTVYAARNDRPSLLPAALWLASPMFSVNGVAIFAVVPYLAARQRPAPLEGVAKPAIAAGDSVVEPARA